MKSHNNNTGIPPDEAKIRSIWHTASQAVEGPSPQVLANIRRAAQAQARQMDQQRARPLLWLPALPWRPLLAIAASLLLLFGSFMASRKILSQRENWREIARVNQEAIQLELEELETTIWNTLTDLEQDMFANDIRLDTLELEMMIWEEI